MIAWRQHLEWFSSDCLPKPAVFLDRDGVINEHIASGYVLRRLDFRWLPGAVENLRRLTDSGHNLFIVTNQSCINRGMLDVSTLALIMMDLVDTLKTAGVPCAAWLCCPHRPDEGCACRKPGTAMLERVAAVAGVSLLDSVLIGDSASDIEAARRVGVAPFLVERNSEQSLADVVKSIIEGAK